VSDRKAHNKKAKKTTTRFKLQCNLSKLERTNPKKKTVHHHYRGAHGPRLMMMALWECGRERAARTIAGPQNPNKEIKKGQRTLQRRSGPPVLRRLINISKTGKKKGEKREIEWKKKKKGGWEGGIHREKEGLTGVPLRMRRAARAKESVGSA